MKKQSKMRCKKSGFRKKAKNANTKSKRNATKNAKNDLLFFCLTCFFCIFIRKNKPKKNAFDFSWPFFAFSFAFFNCSITFAFSFAFFSFFPVLFFAFVGGPSFTFAFSNCFFLATFFQLRFF